MADTVPPSTAPLSAPFPQPSALSTSSLDDDTDGVTYLPGDPSIKLTADNVRNYLKHELSTPVLDELYNSLTWFLQKLNGPSGRVSSNISVTLMIRRSQGVITMGSFDFHD